MASAAANNMDLHQVFFLPEEIKYTQHDKIGSEQFLVYCHLYIDEDKPGQEGEEEENLLLEDPVHLNALVLVPRIGCTNEFY